MDKIPGGYRKAQRAESHRSRDPFYGSARWQMIRRSAISEEPYCRLCGQQASNLDHLDGNTKNNFRCNLVPLCHSCHSWKTNRFDKSAKTSLALVVTVQQARDYVANVCGVVSSRNLVLTPADDVTTACYTSFLLHEFALFIHEHHIDFQTQDTKSVNREAVCRWYVLWAIYTHDVKGVTSNV